MHNGVLASGNAKDTSKSDTWHFIHDQLAPALARSKGKIANRTDFATALGRVIGRDNKFAILGPDGKPLIVNRRSGIEWRGAWFSNTYAWNAPRPKLLQISGITDYFSAAPAKSSVPKRVKKANGKIEFVHESKIWTLEEWNARAQPHKGWLGH
jgi:hypothetical protein